MSTRPVRLVSELARRISAMIDREVHDHLGPDATFEQQQDAAAAISSDALWLNTDTRLRRG